MTLIKTSHQLAPVSIALVISLVSGLAFGQQPPPAPPSPGEQQQPQQPPAQPEQSPPGYPPPAQDPPAGGYPPPAQYPPPNQYQYSPPNQYPPPGQYQQGAPYAPPVAPVAGVPVRFAAGDSGSYMVSVMGAVSGSCQVPCTMPVAPGLNTVRISGTLNMTSNVNIPNAPSVVTIRRGSPGIRTTGMVLFILGSIGGIYLTATQKDASEETTAEAELNLEIAIVDLVLVVVGAVMVLGAAKAGVEIHADSGYRASRSGVRFAGVGAAPVHGGAMLGATLQF